MLENFNIDWFYQEEIEYPDLEEPTADFNPEENEISKKDKSSSIKVSSGSFEIGGIFNPERGEYITIQPIHFPNYVITYKYPTYIGESEKNILVTTQDDPYQALWTLEPSNSDIGSTYIKVNKPIRKEELAKWQRLSDKLKTLNEVYQKCSVENWDGYDAVPISPNAYSEATEVLKMLPSTLPMPEISPEPAGEIALEWYKSKDWIFVISLRGKRTITYAGLFGEKNKTYGTECFEVSLPNIILRSIHRLFPIEE